MHDSGKGNETIQHSEVIYSFIPFHREGCERVENTFTGLPPYIGGNL